MLAASVSSVGVSLSQNVPEEISTAIKTLKANVTDIFATIQASKNIHRVYIPAVALAAYTGVQAYLNSMAYWDLQHLTSSFATYHLDSLINSFPLLKILCFFYFLPQR